MHPRGPTDETISVMQARTPSSDRGDCPGWVRKWLVAAGLYNLLWGALVVAFPLAFFRLLSLDEPVYPQIWQCVGMIVGVYGIGYLVASRDPVRHWPIVLVGFLGKVFGPIGFLSAAARGELPWSFGATILTNDFIWYPSFCAALWCAWRTNMNTTANETTDARTPREAMENAQTSTERTLLEESQQSKLLVVFLRHAGCTFCREAIADLGEKREEIRRTGARIALVYMSGGETIRELAEKRGIGDAILVEDADRALYRAFELRRGSFTQLFGPRVVLRGIAATLRGHIVGKPQGDTLQMPGAFVVADGEIVRAHRHADASDRPDYCELATQ